MVQSLSYQKLPQNGPSKNLLLPSEHLKLLPEEESNSMLLSSGGFATQRNSNRQMKRLQIKKLKKATKTIKK